MVRNKGKLIGLLIIDGLWSAFWAAILALALGTTFEPKTAWWAVPVFIVLFVLRIFWRAGRNSQK